MIVMDRDGPRFDGYYVRVEINAKRDALLVGTTQGGKPAMLSRYAVWEVPTELVRTRREFATIVDSYAQQQHVHNLCDPSGGIRAFYKLEPGEEIYGEESAPAGSRTAAAKQARRNKVRAGESDGR